jgi:hypothetical protein
MWACKHKLLRTLPATWLPAMGFLDPVQIPFNYCRQMAILAIGGNRISIPRDSESREGGAQPHCQSPSTFNERAAASSVPSSPGEVACQEREQAEEQSGSGEGRWKGGLPGVGSVGRSPWDPLC